jgi:carboxymethylenebutenolidase
MNGQKITYPANGNIAQAYLSKPASGKGPGVIVLQEWWGLVDHIIDVCDRLAAEGFVAMAPDMYDGQKTTSPDEAGKLMMALNIAEAGKKLSGAADYLQSIGEVTSQTVGVIGFCMGGQLALYAATISEHISATVCFYGVHSAVKPDYTKLRGPVLGIFAENDNSAPPIVVKALAAEIRRCGGTSDMHIYPGTSHAFFNNARPAVYNPEAAQDAWGKTVRFFLKNVR